MPGLKNLLLSFRKNINISRKVILQTQVFPSAKTSSVGLP